MKRKRLVAAVHGDDITVTGAADVKWMVNELSEVVEVGRRSVRERERSPRHADEAKCAMGLEHAQPSTHATNTRRFNGPEA